MICPFCGQGLVHKLCLVATGGTVYYCDEDDGLWLRPEDIGSEAGSDIRAYYAVHGLSIDAEAVDELFEPESQ